MRLALPEVAGSEGLDGQRGLCFGVLGGSWAPPPAEWVDAQAPPPPSERHGSLSADQKRFQLWKTCDWARMQQLVCDAGLLVRPGGAAGGASGGAAGDVLVVNVPRAMAMLSLMAVHDVMKVATLLPTVCAEHAPYLGYEAGATIYDHDLALGYVLRHDATSLPCVGLLDASQQRPILFTQAKLGFNFGWLVQAEAPPGALFAQAKAAIDEGGASAADLAFYFVHWLTDLAGAEPTPLRGADKFTLKFPHAVGTLAAPHARSHCFRRRPPTSAVAPSTASPAAAQPQAFSSPTSHETCCVEHRCCTSSSTRSTWCSASRRRRRLSCCRATCFARGPRRCSRRRRPQRTAPEQSR